MVTYVLMGAFNSPGFYLYSSANPDEVSSSNLLVGLADICLDTEIGEKDIVTTLSAPTYHVGVRMVPVSVDELVKFVGAVSEARKAKSIQ